MAAADNTKNKEKEIPKVAIVMGSDSDLAVMEETAAILRKFNIPFEITIASAHRSPNRAAQFAAFYQSNIDRQSQRTRDIASAG